MATLKPDPAYADRWFISEAEEKKPQIGVFLSHDPSPELVVYWSGHVARSSLFELIKQAGTALEEKGPVHGRLVAYGKNLREEFPLSDDTILQYFEPNSPLPSFDACRAELTGLAGKVVVWANVTGAKTAGLDRGGENIGVNLSPSLFDGPVRPVISHAIEMTMNLPTKAISGLLDKISESVLRKQRPAAG